MNSMTTTQFQYIAQNIEMNAPLLAILVANEYFDRGHPLRNALAKQAQRRTFTYDKEVVQLILLEGKKAHEIPKSLLTLLQNEYLNRVTRKTASPQKRLKDSYAIKQRGRGPLRATGRSSRLRKRAPLNSLASNR